MSNLCAAEMDFYEWKILCENAGNIVNDDSFSFCSA